MMVTLFSANASANEENYIEVEANETIKNGEPKAFVDELFNQQYLIVCIVCLLVALLVVLGCIVWKWLSRKQKKQHQGKSASPTSKKAPLMDQPNSTFDSGVVSSEAGTSSSKLDDLQIKTMISSNIDKNQLEQNFKLLERYNKLNPAKPANPEEAQSTKQSDESDKSKSASKSDSLSEKLSASDSGSSKSKPKSGKASPKSDSAKKAANKSDKPKESNDSKQMNK